MGGYIELYKINKKKIKDRLYHELINHSLPEIYRAGLINILGLFTPMTAFNAIKSV